MPNANDPRLQVGNRVHTRAKLLKSDSKCRRLYGALWKTKLVKGSVLKVSKTLSKNRRATFVQAKWELSDGTNVVTLHLCSVRSAEAPDKQILQDMPTHSNGANMMVESPSSEDNHEITASEGALVLSTSSRVSDTAPPNGSTVATHGRNWKREEVPLQINGHVTVRPWKVIGPIGEIISYGQSPSQMKPFDLFMCMFPDCQLSKIIEYTNRKLIDCDLPVTTRGEVLKYIGFLILMTRREFSDRRTLWSPSSSSKYLATQNFGDIMSRQRFEDLRQNMGFSKNCDTYGRWGSGCEFISAINDHRSSQVHAIAFALMKVFLDGMVLEVAGSTLAFHTMWPWNGNLNMVVSSKQLHVEKMEFA